MDKDTLKERVIKKFNKKFTASKNGDWVSSEDGDLYTGEDFYPFIEDLIQQAKEEEKNRIVEMIKKMFKPKTSKGHHFDEDDKYNWVLEEIIGELSNTK